MIHFATLALLIALLLYIALAITGYGCRPSVWFNGGPEGDWYSLSYTCRIP